MNKRSIATYRKSLRVKPDHKQDYRLVADVDDNVAEFLVAMTQDNPQITAPIKSWDQVPAAWANHSFSPVTGVASS